jgi:hypothetical protein
VSIIINIIMIITPFHRQQFKPTYLYIKQHAITGKLYFGKTARNNVEKYNGSGIHWSRHVKTHGKDKVVTLWYCLFTDIDNLVETALKMSEIMNIVESDDWLNFKPETGLDGGSVKGHKNKPCSDERRDNIKSARMSTPKKQCPHCGKFADGGNYTRHHGDNCKHNPSISDETLRIKKEKCQKGYLAQAKNGNLKPPKPAHGSYTCVHCGKHGTNYGVMMRWHFDKCKFK